MLCLHCCGFQRFEFSLCYILNWHLRDYIAKAKELYAKETAPPSEVDEEAKNEGGDEHLAAVVADELAVSANLSQAETFLKQIQSNEVECSAESLNKVKAAVRVAERRVTSVVHLVVDYMEADAENLDAQLKGLVPATIRGDEEVKSYVAVVLDAKTLCESGSQSKYRLPPTRGPHVLRLLNALLSTRDDGDLSEGDVLIALDGGKDGDWDIKNVIKHLPSKKYESFKHLVTYTHESAEKRMERASKNNLQLHESVSFISVNELQFKVQPRLVTSGTTRGNVLGPFSRPSWSDSSETWLLPHATKKSIFGKDNMPLPGGPCPIAHESSTALKKDEMAPVFFHEAPSVLASELIHYVQARAVVDLTPGSGHWALQCIRSRIPYCGVCMTDAHKDLLFKKLVSRTLTAMTDASEEELFDAGFAKELKDLTQNQTDQNGEDDPEVNPKRKNKDKQQLAKPPKKLKKDKGESTVAGHDDAGGDSSRAALLAKIAAEAASGGAEEVDDAGEH